MFNVPNKFRVRNHPTLGSDDSIGNSGAFQIPYEKGIEIFAIASDGLGWEHVSVTLTDGGKQETPTWEEMCYVKDLFWSKDATVIEYHPKESEYVNNHNHCLHLWRPINQEMPTPPSILVGTKF